MLPEVTEKEFESRGLKAERPVVVDFSADWCEPCKALKPALSKAAATRKDVEFFVLDADECVDVALHYKIMSIPTLALFQNGKLVATCEGVGDHPLEDVEELLRRIE